MRGLVHAEQPFVILTVKRIRGRWCVWHGTWALERVVPESPECWLQAGQILLWGEGEGAARASGTAARGLGTQLI